MADNNFKTFSTDIVISDADKLQNEFVSAMQKDQEMRDKIASLGLKTIKDVKANIIPLIDYFEDRKICRACPGIDACPKADSPHMRVELFKDGDKVGETKTPCEPFAQRNELLSRYLIRDFPDEWLGKTLRDVDMSKVRNAAVLDLIKLIDDPNGKWVYLNGNVGAGKSYLLSCFASTFAEKNSCQIVYADTRRIIDLLRKASIEDKERFSSIMEAIEEVPLLIFDGFGNEYKSDFAFSTVLYPIISERAAHSRLTLFASDFSYADIEEMYSSKIGKARAKQLIDLLRGKAGKERDISGVAVY